MLRRRKNIINIAVKSKKLNLKMNLVMAVVAVMAVRVLAELAEAELQVMAATPLRATVGQAVPQARLTAEQAALLATAAQEETAVLLTRLQ
jgi:hypothetical protein